MSFTFPLNSASVVSAPVMVVRGMLSMFLVITPIANRVAL